MPRLRCLAGPSPDELYPISVNSNQSHEIKSDLFDGRVAVYIKLDPPSGRRRRSGSSGRSSRSASPPYGETGSDGEYFSRSDRRGVTWSIQVQGRFLKKTNADDILFGNTFDRPLKLPWGTGAVLKFMHFIDPTMEHDLAGPKPWALSPLISTMPYFHHEPLSSRIPTPLSFPWEDSIEDDVSSLKSTSGNLVTPKACNSSKDRRSFFANASNRQDVSFGPNDLITTDFCYGFLKFPELYLNLPVGMSFDLKKYWDGQPVRFVCCERHPDGFEHARTFWCVVFEIVEDEDDEDEESEGGFAAIEPMR